MASAITAKVVDTWREGYLSEYGNLESPIRRLAAVKIEHDPMTRIAWAVENDPLPKSRRTYQKCPAIRDIRRDIVSLRYCLCNTPSLGG